MYYFNTNASPRTQGPLLAEFGIPAEISYLSSIEKLDRVQYYSIPSCFRPDLNFETTVEKELEVRKLAEYILVHPRPKTSM